MTGSRRRFSTVSLPGPIADMFGLDEDERVITIEHHDEGLSSSEIPYYQALWELKNEESKSK